VLAYFTARQVAAALVLAGALSTPAAGLAAATPDAAGVQAFIASLYAHYRQPSNTTWDYVDPGDAATYEPGLLKAMRDDSAAHPDAPGTSWGDVDILCMCQEYDRIAETTVVQPPAANGHAKAVTTVTVRDGGTSYKTVLHFDLAPSAGAWRVYDVGETGHSFRDLVMSDLAAARHH
jgi:hypothetical protein